ncbi:hypothetical protein PATSB16_21930 [Pandoraea thiooxydans]|nr:hypothetical protein PATSB16_21930 [Pandoraea thiooxydans]
MPARATAVPDLVRESDMRSFIGVDDDHYANEVAVCTAQVER